MSASSNIRLFLALRPDWTQRRLAEAVGCSENWLSRVARGEDQPSPQLRHRLAVALDVPEVILFPAAQHEYVVSP